MQAGNLLPDCYHFATGCRQPQPNWPDKLEKMSNKIAYLRPALTPGFGRDLILKLTAAKVRLGCFVRRTAAAARDAERGPVTVIAGVAL